jgi:hypothetical protein
MDLYILRPSSRPQSIRQDMSPRAGNAYSKKVARKEGIPVAKKERIPLKSRSPVKHMFKKQSPAKKATIKFTEKSRSPMMKKDASPRLPIYSEARWQLENKANIEKMQQRELLRLEKDK